MNALWQLIGLKKEYENACKQWQTILEMLRKVSEMKEIQKTQTKHDEIDDHCITYHFTDTKLFCSFSFNNHNAVLTYGYVDQDEYMRPRYVPTSQQFVDKEGNVRNKLEAAMASWNIDDIRDYVGFFFPQILNAQKKAWEKLIPEDEVNK